MNREIKFRVWDKRNKCMRRVSDIHFGADGATIIVQTEPTETEFNVNILDGVNGYLMQHTGIKDKNNTDIYDGDIVKDDGDRLFVVRWWAGKDDHLGHRVGWVLDDKRLIGYRGISHAVQLMVFLDMREDYYNGEVIGNIYENADLVGVCFFCGDSVCLESEKE